MKVIWYLLECPKGNEARYAEEYCRLMGSDNDKEIVCFQYQRMMRYQGQWHLVNRALLPGYIFLLDSGKRQKKERINIPLKTCEVTNLKSMCQKDNLIGISSGIIKDGYPIVTDGPLQGKEKLIRKIDRHKRIAEIEIFLAGRQKRVTVGLEVYEKQI